MTALLAPIDLTGTPCKCKGSGIQMDRRDRHGDWIMETCEACGGDGVPKLGGSEPVPGHDAYARPRFNWAANAAAQAAVFALCFVSMVRP